eukprot:2368165-Rhodomonas_salina.3
MILLEHAGMRESDGAAKSAAADGALPRGVLRIAVVCGAAGSGGAGRARADLHTLLGSRQLLCSRGTRRTEPQGRRLDLHSPRRHRCARCQGAGKSEEALRVKEPRRECRELGQSCSLAGVSR